LTAPILEEAPPAPGKRVEVVIGDVYCCLYLPLNYVPGNYYSLLFDTPGNAYAGYSGLPDDIILGYGLSGGNDFIWVQAPFVNTDKDTVLTAWWGDGTQGSDPTCTIEVWQDILTEMKANYNIKNVIFSGFSRGAIAAANVGCYNDAIAAEWDAYIPNSYYDTSPVRTARVNGKKTLLIAGELDVGRTRTLNGQTLLNNLGYPNTYIEIPGGGHSPDWCLLDTDEASEARLWLSQYI
jgi:predicted esterase